MPTCIQRKRDDHRPDPVPHRSIPSSLAQPPARVEISIPIPPSHKLHRVPGSHETSRTRKEGQRCPRPSRSTRHLWVSMADPCAARCPLRGVQSAWRGTKKSKTDNCRPAAVSSRGCALRGLIHPSIHPLSPRGPSLCALQDQTGQARPGPPCWDGRRRPGPTGNQISIPRTTTLDGRGSLPGSSPTPPPPTPDCPPIRCNP